MRTTATGRKAMTLAELRTFVTLAERHGYAGSTPVKAKASPLGKLRELLLHGGTSERAALGNGITEAGPHLSPRQRRASVADAVTQRRGEGT